MRCRVILVVLACLAIAYRFYSAFLAAKVAVLDDSRTTPAHAFNDGQNYHPTHKWVLFGHHFAAISGAGPLIGPVLAIQFGYLPGLIWIVVGVCLAGAVQDMLVLAAIGPPRRPLAGRDRPGGNRPAGRRHGLDRHSVRGDHRAVRAGRGGRQGARRRRDQAGRRHAMFNCPTEARSPRCGATARGDFATLPADTRIVYPQRRRT